MIFYQRISRWSNQHPFLMTFLFGACIGFIASVVYLISGGETFVFVPTWASIIFYPGFLAGNLVYGKVGFSGAYTVGILMMGLSYGTIALGLRQLLRVVRERL